MRVLVHAGLNKTGSSSLQLYLSRHRASLEASGVIYPDLGATNHWRLVAALMKRDSGKRQGDGYLHRQTAGDPMIPHVLDALAERIARLPSDAILLLSHENLGSYRRMDQLRGFLAAVDARAEMTVFVYCREPASLYRSSLQHRIRTDGSITPVEHWISPHVRRARALQEMTGIGLTLRCYGPHLLVEGDVVTDFRAWFAAETGRALPPADRRIGANAALSAQACALLVAARREIEPGRWQAFSKQVATFDVSWPGGSRLELPSAVVAWLRGRHRAEWNALVRIVDHPRETKRRLKIARDESSAVPVDTRQVEEWLRAFASEDYARAFREAPRPAQRDRSRSGPSPR